MLLWYLGIRGKITYLRQSQNLQICNQFTNFAQDVDVYLLPAIVATMVEDVRPCSPSREPENRL
jgi:hypothetical protein